MGPLHLAREGAVPRKRQDRHVPPALVTQAPWLPHCLKLLRKQLPLSLGRAPSWAALAGRQPVLSRPMERGWSRAASCVQRAPCHLVTGQLCPGRTQIPRRCKLLRVTGAGTREVANETRPQGIPSQVPSQESSPQASETLGPWDAVSLILLRRALEMTLGHFPGCDRAGRSRVRPLESRFGQPHLAGRCLVSNGLIAGHPDSLFILARLAHPWPPRSQATSICSARAGGRLWTWPASCHHSSHHPRGERKNRGPSEPGPMGAPLPDWLTPCTAPHLPSSSEWTEALWCPQRARSAHASQQPDSPPPAQIPLY